MSHRVIYTVSLLVFLFSQSSPAQFTERFVLEEVGTLYHFDSELRNAGDVDADGINDFVIGSPSQTNQPIANNTGTVRVYSGANGLLIHEFLGLQSDSYFGARVNAAGDVNNDGHGDIIVGIPRWSGTSGMWHGAYKVFSGLDGSVLFSGTGSSAQDQMGDQACALGDLNGDGFGDYAVSERGWAGGNGRVIVYSGFDASALLTFSGVDGGALGASLANADDVNGDGVNDIIIGEPGFDIGFPPATLGTGRALVYSGSDGTLLWTLGQGPFLSITGAAVEGAGDLNGDGFGDFMVGRTGSSNVDVVFVRSGMDGSTLFNFGGSLFQTPIGHQVRNAGDLNGDGINDIAMGVEQSITPSLILRSGADGSFLGSLLAPISGLIAVTSFDGLGDINGDGRGDLAFGTFLGPANRGEIRVYLGGVAPVAPFMSQSGNPAGLNLSWIPDGGHPNADTGTLSCTGATPGGLGLILVSLARADLAVLGFDLLCAIDPTNLLLTATLGANIAGEFNVNNVSRRNPFLAGTRMFVQFIETSPNLQASRGFRFIAIP